MGSSYWRKLLYAFGMFGVTLSYQAFTGWIQFYYLDILRLAPAAMSVAWVIFTICRASSRGLFLSPA
jgi:Na+/melibiose symporter-like transporter